MTIRVRVLSQLLLSFAFLSNACVGEVGGGPPEDPRRSSLTTTVCDNYGYHESGEQIADIPGVYTFVSTSEYWNYNNSSVICKNIVGLTFPLDATLHNVSSPDELTASIDGVVVYGPVYGTGLVANLPVTSYGIHTLTLKAVRFGGGEITNTTFPFMLVPNSRTELYAYAPSFGVKEGCGTNVSSSVYAETCNNSYIENSFVVPTTGMHAITVNASGNLVRGVWPNALVEIDAGVAGGVAVAGMATINSTQALNYTFHANLTAGTHWLDVYMSNDAPFQATGSNLQLGLVQIVSGGRAIVPLPTITSFAASAAKIPKGGAVQLSWSVANASFILIADQNNEGVNTWFASGAVRKFPTASSTYKLTAYNSAGSSVSKSVFVSVY